MSRRDLWLLPCGLISLALCFGCSPDNPLGRYSVSGSVTLDGEPLAEGNIEFHPISAGGVQSGGRIVDGSYSIPEHEGVTAGKYRVSITDFVPTPPTPEGYMPGDPLPPAPKPKVPASWNSKSQHTVDVTADGALTFDFAILTKEQ